MKSNKTTQIGSSSTSLYRPLGFKLLSGPLVILFGILRVANVHAASFTISTSLNQLQPGVDNQGWWASNVADNNHTNDNYFTGFYQNGEYRSFFSFDLSGVSGTVTSATLNVRRYAQTGPLTLGLFDVSTPASTLITCRQEIMSPAIFADLGSGTSYGSFSVSTGLWTDVLSFSLNANALADINAVSGSGYFSIGGAVLGSSGYIFSGSSEEPGNSNGTLNSIQELVLTTIPEPSTFVIVSIGVTVLLSSRRSRYGN